MKRLKILFTVLCALCSTMTFAHDFEVDGIYYNITDATNKTVAVTYSGSSFSSVNNEYTGSVVIPESVSYNGKVYSVTNIGNDAFYGCSGLTSVVIGNSVTSIGDYAFQYCSGLTSITIPNSVTSIGSYTFRNCSGLTIITIGNSVTSIGDEAFSGCFGLTSIIVEPGNPKYDSRENCNAIVETESNTLISGCKNTIIPNSVTSIGEYAFYYCFGITSVTIPNSVTSIGYYAFYGCSGLTSVVIGNSVTSIGDYAFCDCWGLTSVVIGNSVTSIGEYAFSSCSGLTCIIVEPGNPKYDSRENCNAVIETESNTLVSGCKNTIIPNSVTSIGYYAFSGCSGLTGIVIPNSVTSIGDWAFGICSGLTGIEIPNSVTSIGISAFNGCSGLTSITIPNSVTSIGENAFSNCSGLTSIIVEPGNPKYDSRENCNAVIETESNTLVSGCKNTIIPNSVTSIGEDAFYGCYGLTGIEIPNSVTSIGYWAFCNCSGLTSITIPNIVTSIGDWAFSGCSGLTSITIPNSVTSIGDYAFSGCFGLTSITIPNSVTSIGEYAFSNCSGLTSIEIPNSVTSIGERAFYDCSGLKTVINLSNLTFSKGSSDYGYVAYYADKVINGAVVGDFVFSTVDDKHTLVAYLGDATDVTLPGDYNGENYAIGDNVFKNNSSITSIEIPNSVTSIGNCAFAGCSGLTRVDIVDGVKSIGLSAFADCNKLEEVYISNTIESIGEKAFSGCTNILEIFVGSKKAIAGNENIFSEDTYNNALLHVPQGRKFAYERIAPWSRFYIVEMDFTGVEDINEQGTVNNIVYDLRGSVVENPTNGIYIVNGKKVLVK